MGAGGTEPTLASFGLQPWWIVIIKSVAILLFLLLGTMLTIWAERRLIGRMQNRPGPNRAGPCGLLQVVADALKLTLKEDIVPRGADKVLFWLAPVVSATPSARPGSRSSRSGPWSRSPGSAPRCSSPTCRPPCCWCSR